MSRRLSLATAACIALVVGSTGFASAAPGSDPDRAALSVGRAKTCVSPDGRYDVTAPGGAPSAGVDPAEVAAANCTIGFHEERAYPLSVIGLSLLATVGTLVLVRRRRSPDLIGSEA